MTKLKLKVKFLNLSKNPVFYIFFCKCFAIFFHYTKMFKHLSAKYYQENKEIPQKKACERYQNLSIEEKQEKKAIIWSWNLQKSLWRWKK